jgi:hypothetical protein
LTKRFDDLPNKLLFKILGFSLTVLDDLSEALLDLIPKGNIKKPEIIIE